MTIPILVYTDAPSHNTGLARICRELCAHIHENLADVFRVATLGVFGRGSAQYPWMQYSANGPEDALYNLREITEDFFGEDRGVVFSITPPSWLFALSLPQFMHKEDPKWQLYADWIATKPFEHWAYLAIESHGPLGQFGPQQAAILRAIDRRLYYSKWGTEIDMASAITKAGESLVHIGHGIDTERWAPALPETVRTFRSNLSVGPNDLLLGCVATNTRRKLLPLLFESAYMLRHQLGYSRLVLWLNTDVAIREYNLTELAACYGFREGADYIITSSNAKRSDKWLAAMYSACDLTCLPTAGEGFGYPIVESLSCGTPAVTGTFGAQAEFLTGWRDSWLCPVQAQHIITNSTLVEPIYDPAVFASRLLMAWTELRHSGTLLREECRARASIWSWANMWPAFERWFLIGAAELQAKAAKAKEVEDASKVDVRNDSETGQGNGLGSAVGADANQQGPPADLRDAGRLDSGAPERLDREVDPATVGGPL